MTATAVGNLRVIGAEPAHSPLSKPDNPVLFKQIMLLTLENDTAVFGCAHCDFTSEVLGKVRYHLRTHGPASDYRRVQHTGRDASTEPRLGHLNGLAGMPLIAVLQLASRNEKLLADRDHWRERARVAEKKLATLRGVMRSITDVR